MKAGFAQIDYTPPAGFMPGEFTAHFAKGAYTPLTANAAAFENAGEAVILISADHLLFHTAYADRIRGEIAAATGLATDRILLAATHTHMGPSYDKPCWKSPAEPEIADVVAHRIIKAGIKAFENMREGAEIGVGTGKETRFAFCRDVILTDGRIKTNPGYDRTDILKTCDTPDHTVEVMRVTMDGKLAAILVNHANHPDTNNGKSRKRNKFCADWPGFMRKALQEKYGEDVTVLFFNGCCGDINHHDFVNKTCLQTYWKEDVVAPEYIGYGMADTVAKVLDGITENEKDNTVAVLRNNLTLARRQILDSELAWAHEVLEAAKTEYPDVAKYGTAIAYINGSKNLPETTDFLLTGYRVGPWGMIAMPGEMYTAVGRSIKEGSPFAHTIPVELANGHNGYVIPDDVRDNGSYEGRFSSGVTGPGAMDAIVAGGIETLKKLY